VKSPPPHRPRTGRPPARRARGLGVAALALLLGLGAGCSSKPVYRTRPGEPVPGARPPTASVPGPPGFRVEEVAIPWVGTPYRYGGVDERGVDCSGLVQNVLGDLGTRVPRTTRAQRRAGRSVTPGEIRSGDLLFFRLESSTVNHVGIALGPDRFIHASSSRGVVVDRLMDEYFARRFVEARRVHADP